MNIHLNSASGSPASQHCSVDSGPDWRAHDIDSMDKQEWSAIEFLRILYKRRSTLMYIVGASIAAAGLISLGQPRWYRSEASIEIQGINENFLSTRDIYPTLASAVDSSGTYVQTQADILEQDA